VRQPPGFVVCVGWVVVVGADVVGIVLVVGATVGMVVVVGAGAVVAGGAVVVVGAVVAGWVVVWLSDVAVLVDAAGVPLSSRVMRIATRTPTRIASRPAAMSAASGRRRWNWVPQAGQKSAS
jgi:hypothetical protein